MCHSFFGFVCYSLCPLHLCAHTHHPHTYKVYTRVYRFRTSVSPKSFTCHFSFSSFLFVVDSRIPNHSEYQICFRNRPPPNISSLDTRPGTRCVEARAILAKGMRAYIIGTDETHQRRPTTSVHKLHTVCVWRGDHMRTEKNELETATCMQTVAVRIGTGL